MPAVARAPEPVIRVIGLTRRFGAKTVLDGLSLSIQRCETLAVIGGSGAGKSTFAKLLVGLDRPTSGRIVIDGVEMTRLHDRELQDVRKRIGVVFQHSALLDSMTVFDNVAFPLREDTDMSERAIDERVTHILEELGVAAARDKLPGELSGGMAKRVGIARAMVMRPEILVYDEPTSGLDPLTARHVDAMIERMRERFLVTSVVITHDMITAFDCADRVAVLAGGRFIALGSPASILSSTDAVVHDFIVASGVDLASLGARGARPSAAALAREWIARPLRR